MRNSEHHIKQVFQTNKRTRWLSALWFVRLFFIILIIFISAFTYSVIQNKYPNLPKITSSNLETTPSKLNPTKAFFVKKNEIKKNILNAKKNNITDSNTKNYIRSAFYVSWDPLSYYSLQKNISKLNYIIPEWFALNTASDTFTNTLDLRGLCLMKAYNKKIIPILSNNDGKDFNENLFNKYCSTEDKRIKCVHQITALLKYYQFQGINIDFEEISNTNTKNLNEFQKLLYNTLHPLGYTVTIDVPVLNDSYDYKTLQNYSDYIFAMAYDENNSVSEAGPIAEQLWMEDALIKLNKDVPSNKIILCMPSYGYDWTNNEEAKSIPFYEAIALAKQNNQTINYNNNTYNLNFTYYDTISKKNHEVYFADACTNFNEMRFADDNGFAGVSIWRLGSEDNRLWNFYNLALDKTSLQKNKLDFKNSFSTIKNTEGINYLGEGEILDVLSVPTEGEINIELDTTEQLIAEQNYKNIPTGFVVRKFGKANKKIVLTFDDGPDPEYTPKILNILKKENVPATFFIVGLKAQDNFPIIENMYQNGFEIGNHTLTHINMSTASNDRADFETTTTRKLIETITGHSTILFRAPYNADSQPETQAEMAPIARCRNENYYTIAENIDPTDWKEGTTTDSIVNRVLMQLPLGNIILLHDAGGDRTATINALPILIKRLKDKGYIFTTVANLMGKTKDEIMPVITNINKSESWNLKLNYWFAKCMYWATHLLSSIFIIGIILSILRTIFIAILAIKNYTKNKHPIFALNKINTPVSVIIPAYNEEINILKTIQSVLNTNYKNLEIIVVDDGSTDSTYKKVQAEFSNYKNVQLITKSNGGKASALNLGINNANNEIIICIDADTQLKEDAIENLIPYFNNPKIGAVAGNVKVGNEINLLTRWQNIEYITSQNFDRRAFDELNCITVVPGAIGAFRKSAIIAAGFYTSDTLAEDCDLSIRILRKGYKIVNSANAISYTEAPESLSMFLKQRYRWSFGIMQSFWKNKKICFNKKYKNLGFVAMPNILIFQIILPLLAPFADLVLIWALINGKVNDVVHAYFLFMIVDLISACIAFIIYKEKWSKLLWLIPQRLIYRQLMYYILYRSIRKALKGEIQGWGSLKRTGNILIKQ